MQHIETVTVGSGGSASITFSTIPATFTDLVIVTSLRTTRANNMNDQIFIEFNGVTSGNTVRELVGSGSAVGTFTESFIHVYATASGATANTFGSCFTYIPNYLSSSQKSVSSDSVAENNATQGVQSITAGLSNTTVAITSIRLISRFSQTLLQHSSASLYGITAGSSGGVVVS